MSYICIIYTSSCSVVVSCTGSGVCEWTNQSLLGVQEEGLKETGAKTERTWTWAENVSCQDDDVFTHHHLPQISVEVVGHVFQGGDGTSSDRTNTKTNINNETHTHTHTHTQSLWSSFLVVLAYLHGLGVVGSEELEAVVWTRGVSSVLANVKHCETKRGRDAASVTADRFITDLKTYFYCVY